MTTKVHYLVIIKEIIAYSHLFCMTIILIMPEFTPLGYANFLQALNFITHYSLIIAFLGNLHTCNKSTSIHKIDLYERHFACAVSAAEARHTAVPSANARSANTTRGGDGSSGSTWTSRIGASCRSSGTNFRVRGFADWSRTDYWTPHSSWYACHRAFSVDARQARNPPWSTG